MVRTQAAYKTFKTLLGSGALALTSAVVGLAPGIAHGSGTSHTAAAPVEITYTYGSTGVPTDVSMVQAALNAILVKKINATVQLNPVDWGSYDQKRKLAFAAGEPCDLVFTAPWINNYYQLVANGDLLPLDDLLPKDAPKTYASLPRADWNAVRINGKIYAVINQQLFPKYWGVQVRQDLARKIGLNVDKLRAYKDLTSVLAKLKAAAPGVTPLYSDDQGGGGLFFPEQAGFDPLIDAAAVRYNDRSLRVFDPAETPEFKQAVTLAYQWHRAGYYTTDPMPVSDALAAFKAGRFAATIAQARPSEAEMAKSKAQYGWDFVQKSFTKPLLTTAALSATMTGVCRSSRNPDAALRFLELLNTDPQVYNLMTHGIAGKHYVVVDKAHSLIGLPKGVTTSTDGYYPNTDWEFGNQFNAFYTDKSQIGSWPVQQQGNLTAIPSVALGFSPTTDKIKAQVAQVTAAEKQYGQPLMQGLVNPATGLPRYIQALKAAGADRIVAEVQSQLNAWAQANKK